MLRFVHTADWQLGMRRWFLPAEAAARFQAARLEAVRRLGAAARAREAAFVLVCGDVFESHRIAAEVFHRALDALAACPLPVFLLPGNHDPLGPGSLFDGPEWDDAALAHVTVLRPGAVHHPAPGVELAGAPWTSKRPAENPLRALLAALAPPRGLRIVAGHGPIAGLGGPAGAPGELQRAELEEALESGLCHYIALGDRHSETRLPPEERIAYPGAPEPTDFDEERAGGVLLVELEAGCAPRLERLELGTWRFVEERAVLAGREDVAALERALAALPDKDRTIVKLVLEGSLEPGERAELERRLQALAPRFAALFESRGRSRLATRPPSRSADELGLSGHAREVYERLRARAVGAGAEAETARAALGLLLELVQGAGS